MPALPLPNLACISLAESTICNFSVGESVPIPTLPLASMRIRSENVPPPSPTAKLNPPSLVPWSTNVDIIEADFVPLEFRNSNDA